MPVFDTFGDGDDRSGCERDGRFVPLLIPTATADADEYLHGAMVDMPVVAATRFEGDVGDAVVGMKETVADEILRIGGVRVSLRPLGL